MNTDTIDTGPSRRTVLATSAWAVPAIVAATGTPAFAGTGTQTLAVSTPNMQAIAKGDTPVTVTVTDSAGQPVTGDVVSLSGPTGVTFSPTTASVTNGVATATMTTTDNWAIPGSVLTVTAVSGGGNTSAGLTVLGANALAVSDNSNGAAGTGASANPLVSMTQLSLVFPSPIVALSNGISYSLALLQDGTVWSIGINTDGQLGDGTTTARTTWARIPGLSGVTQICAGSSTAWALLGTGAIRAWGSGGYGGLGNGSTTSTSSPVAVSGITTATQIAGDRGYCLALLSSGEVKAWGNNFNGQLGDGTSVGRNTPVTAVGLSGITEVAAGGNSSYARSNGQVYAWGYGAAGQMGRGTRNDTNRTPTAAPSLTNVAQLRANSGSAYAVLDTGEVRAWGQGSNGQLGDGGAVNSATPVAVQGISNATDIYPMGRSAYAKLATGEFRAWGANDKHQLNDGSTTDRPSPVTPQDVTGITSWGYGASAGTVFGIR